MSNVQVIVRRRPFSDRLIARLNHRQEYHVIRLGMLDRHLSPVRDQAEANSCCFIATIACIEAVYRTFGKILNQEWNELYYFDFNECYDLLYKELHTLEDAAEIANGSMLGGRVVDVLTYAMYRGLLATTVDIEPRERNHVAHFDKEARRYHISGFKSLTRSEVVDCVKEFPVIAYLPVSSAFEGFKKAVYEPEDEEICPEPTNHAEPEDKKNCPELTYHAVLGVGTAVVTKGHMTKLYLIIQNSHATTFGFEGYVLVPLGKFKGFWLPLIYPQMEHLSYGKVEMQREPLKVYNRTKKKRVASPSGRHG